MQTNFQIESSDTVKLVGKSEDVIAGWVNVGVHSIRIEQGPDGDLKVQSFARDSERRPLAMLMVTADYAKSEGGADPDVVDEDGPDGEFGIIVDGIVFKVSVSGKGKLIEVVDEAGGRVADVRRVSSSEQSFVTHYDTDGCYVDSAPRDIYDSAEPLEVARWAVSTHPING